MDSVGTQNWGIAYSPDSIDSGVELSPSRSQFGSSDDGYGGFYCEMPSPESPPWSSSVSPHSDDFAYSQCDRIPNQLTDDEIEALSKTFSPVPIDQQSIDLVFGPTPDSQELDRSLINPTVPASSDNTQRRRRRQRERQSLLFETHPGIDPCLVPKSGTAKPRQSRTRRKSTTKSMAGGQGGGMNVKKCYSGARVKVTAKERLQQIRNEKITKRTDGVTSELGKNISLGQEPPLKRRCPMTSEDCTVTCVTTLQNTGTPVLAVQPYTHSVNQILQMAPQRYEPDDLELCIARYLQYNDQIPLREYVRQNKPGNYSTEGYAIRDGSGLRYWLGKLNDRKDRYNAGEMCLVAELFCELFREDINCENLNGETPIYEAALHGNEGVVQALMKFDANPWKKEKKGGHSSLHAAVRSKKIGVVSAILDAIKLKPQHFETGINFAASDGNTALHAAAALSDIAVDDKKTIICKLLECGADTTKKNNMSQMPHSFLNDPKLKDLLMHMKRLNQKRKSVPHQPLQPPALDAHTQYATYPPHPYSANTSDSFYHQSHITHTSASFPQHLSYSTLPHNVHQYPPMTSQQSIHTVMEPTPCTASPPEYYGSRTPAVTNSVYSGTSQPHIDEFIDFF